MKKRNTLVALVFVLIIHIGKAQITQLELASGAKKTDFTSILFRPLNSEPAFTMATLAFFQKYHLQEDQMFDEVGVQTTLYWNINEAISVGPGLYFNSIAGFSERLSVLFAIRSSNFILNAIPTLVHVEQTGFINGEMFLQMQWIRSLQNNWKLLLSVQMLTSWDEFSRHARSFQQLRVGVETPVLQFGVAIDFDQYGDSPLVRTSPGVFIRKIFLNH